MSLAKLRAGDALQTESINFAGLSDLWSATEREERARILAQVVLAVFEDYYGRFRQIPALAKAAFEARDWQATVRLSAERLSIYSISIDKLAPVLHAGCPEIADDEGFWALVETDYLALIGGRYEADLAFAFLTSIRRKVFENEWRPVAYSYGRAGDSRREGGPAMLVAFDAEVPLAPDVVRRILATPAFAAAWRDAAGDARLVAAEITDAVRRLRPGGGPVRIEMVNAGFFRNRGAYLVGRMATPEGEACPLCIALLHGGDGLFVDAVLSESDELQYVFSTTLANFNVTSPRYHELAKFLFGLMPKRPIGTHYSTIGFNHLGKIAVMDEIAGEHARTGEQLAVAVGFRGTVAIGFSMPSSRYVLKIIRDRPTAGYKWGTFPGIPRVLEKYRVVHEIDRAGSMLDNIIFSNVRIDRGMLSAPLLEEILADAAQTVSLQGDDIVFKHLIVQMKMIPLPTFLESASPAEARTAVLNLGDCIKNNAAANIFNKDLDGRNYGVSPILKVYLFDYDAVEPLVDVKVRTNADREEGEEGIPDWYFEDGTVFLPEEMLAGLRIADRDLRRLFREAHPELLAVDYWEGMQRALRDGEVPRVRSYPEARRLRRDVADGP
jgi:isocitrate dehydrogenase kinase/phosphatase